MPPLESRRSERIDYHAPVELLAHAEGVGMPSCVLARTLDLGPGGMQLCAPVQMEVGAHVTCRMTLDGRPAALPGRVAWLRERDSTRRDDGHGMGICFDPLESHQSALLQHVVARSSTGFRAIALNFAGLEQPVVAQAHNTSSGLRITAELPILARGTEVSFRLDEEGPLFNARIGDAMLREERGARRLEVEVEVIEGDSPRFRRHARYGYPDEIRALEHVETTVVAASPAIEASHAEDRTTIAATQPRAPVGAGSTFLAAAAVGAALMTWVVVRGHEPSSRHSEFVVRPRPPAAASPAPQDEPLVLEPAPLPRGAAEPRLAPLVTDRTSVPLDVERAITTTSQGPAPKAQSAATTTRDEQAEGVPGMQDPRTESANRTAAAVAPARASSAPAPQAGTAAAVSDAATTAPATPPLAQPAVSVAGDVTLVRIPFEGSLDGMNARTWASPRALAVDLPHGSTLLTLGRYPIGQGEVTDLQLNTRRSELLVRVKVSAEISHYTVAQADGWLELRLTRAGKAQTPRLLTPAAFRKDGPQ